MDLVLIDLIAIIGAACGGAFIGVQFAFRSYAVNPNDIPKDDE